MTSSKTCGASAWRSTRKGSQRTRFPDHIDEPIFSQTSVDTPQTLGRFDGINADREPANRIKMCNFVLQAHIADEPHARTVAEKLSGRRYPASKPIGLMRPFSKATEMRGAGSRKDKTLWLNPHGPEQFPITTEQVRHDGEYYVSPEVLERVQVDTFREALRRYRRHPEHKSVGADGLPCRPDTRGLLGRAHVSSPAARLHISKEGRMHYSETTTAAEYDRDHPVYDDRARKHYQQLVVPVLRDMPVEVIVEQTGLSEDTVLEHRTGRVKRPRRDLLAALEMAASLWARDQLKGTPHEVRASGTHEQKRLTWLLT